jgi:hypothetical protein
MGEILQRGIPEGDSIGATAEPHDQFPEPADDGLPLLVCGRILKGDLSLGMGCGDPFQDGALVRVVLGCLALKIVQKNG